MAAGDGFDFKQIGGLVGIGGLPVGHRLLISVVSVGAYKVRGRGDVLLDNPLHGIVGSFVGFGSNLELAGLVFLEVVYCLPPGAVHLADGRVAQLHLHRLVRRVSRGRESLVQTPGDPDFVLPTFQNCIF